MGSLYLIFMILIRPEQINKDKSRASASPYFMSALSELSGDGCGLAANTGWRFAQDRRVKDQHPRCFRPVPRTAEDKIGGVLNTSGERGQDREAELNN